ncbi:MAG: hypothetical protein JKY96_06345 [Phycisphaerales bacterium]|nr:hypothetical protein [Phycisphaerales bacterium]
MNDQNTRSCSVPGRHAAGRSSNIQPAPQRRQPGRIERLSHAEATTGTPS